PIFLGINTLIILRCVRRLQDLRRDGPTSMFKLAAVTGLGFALCSLGLFAYDQLQSGIGPAVQTDKLYAVRDYFPLFEGNEWTYRVTSGNPIPSQRTYRIQAGDVISGQNTMNMHVTDNTYLAVMLDSYGIRLFRNVTNGRAFTYDPPGIYLPNLYLYQEKTFSAHVTADNSSSTSTSPFEEQILFRLRAIDNIELASGLYPDCLRVEYEQKIGDSNGGFRVVKGTSWFAPRVGKIKENRQIQIQNGAGLVLNSTEEELELVDVKIRKW
ncbi:MAG: hypothetical protein K8I00_00415, partial [Candidatus Omnitrophica bacterium]|nr:hypothetical protein [Candidatus Omnitrophota bacterium]